MAKKYLTRLSTDEKFLARLSTPDSDGCILWLGGKTGRGYGVIRDNKTKKLIQIHRYAWIRIYGDISQGLCVCHKCDIPLCCNINHLFLGTHQDNMQDREIKGRGCQGERNGLSKLTEKSVKIARISHSEGRKTIARLARKFGVSHWVMSRAIKREIWKHVK